MLLVNETIKDKNRVTKANLIPIACPDIDEKDEAVTEVVRSGWITMGKKFKV